MFSQCDCLFVSVCPCDEQATLTAGRGSSRTSLPRAQEEAATGKESSRLQEQFRGLAEAAGLSEAPERNLVAV